MIRSAYIPLLLLLSAFLLAESSALPTKLGAAGKAATHDDDGEQTCGENEQYNECAKADSCEPTCEQPDGPDACTEMCYPAKCQCKKGYVRNGDKKCVAKDDC